MMCYRRTGTRVLVYTPTDIAVITFDKRPKYATAGDGMTVCWRRWEAIGLLTDAQSTKGSLHMLYASRGSYFSTPRSPYGLVCCTYRYPVSCIVYPENPGSWILDAKSRTVGLVAGFVAVHGKSTPAFQGLQLFSTLQLPNYVFLFIFSLPHFTFFVCRGSEIPGTNEHQTPNARVITYHTHCPSDSSKRGGHSLEPGAIMAEGRWLPWKEQKMDIRPFPGKREGFFLSACLMSRCRHVDQVCSLDIFCFS